MSDQKAPLKAGDFVRVTDEYPAWYQETHGIEAEVTPDSDLMIDVLWENEGKAVVLHYDPEYIIPVRRIVPIRMLTKVSDAS